MFLPLDASAARKKEAENARKNRMEIVRALSHGQINRRDLFKWGLVTTTGAMVSKHGLSKYVSSAYAEVPTGTPRSPLFGAKKFTQKMPRASLQTPIPLVEATDGSGDCYFQGTTERPACRYSYHTHYNEYAKTYTPDTNPYRNPMTGRGPCEGRPWGEWFAHQRWTEPAMRPKVGYVMTWGEVQANSRFHPLMPAQNPESVWCFGSGAKSRGNPVPPLIKARYGEPMVMRMYNWLPDDPTKNGGFGRNECSLHLHNAHNGAESDGASNAFHFPGTFYDYHWATTLARHDYINTGATDSRASGPDGNGGINRVPGDFRELLSSLWFHDHRFFFTAENVHKGNFGLINFYSGPDRGNEALSGGGVNHKLPSGKILDWGNVDFDVNLAITNPAFDQAGQMFFDIFDTDGFLGDMHAVNGVYAPYMEVLPRKYRFRILNAAMSRFIKLTLVDKSNKAVPLQFIANDGNFVVNPIPMTGLDIQGVAERFDIVVDFSRFRPGDNIHLVNLLQQTNGRRPDGAVTIAQAMSGVADDPCVGPILQFRVVSEVESVDRPGFMLDMSKGEAKDTSQVPLKLTEQIPIVTPVRERVIEWTRGGGDLNDPSQCVPDCGGAESFPWTVKVNGASAHSANANRIGLLIPRPNEVEHWTYVNSGGGWDHPIHLHFEEGVTINRGGDTIPASEKLVRKDVWRLRPSGRVKFQVRFSEYGGAYVNHCHNTVHEDFAMLLRMQLQSGRGMQMAITPTPNPTRDGVTYTTPKVYPEGDPTSRT